MQTSELREPKFRCTTCGRTFISNYSAKTHRRDTGHNVEGADMQATEQPTPAVQEPIGIKGEVDIVLRGPDGEVKQLEHVDNLITTVGRNAIIEQLEASPAVNKPSHMAIGTGTNAAAAGDTALQTELDRNALTSKSVAANVATMVGDWAAGDGTGAITEAGILNAGAAGDLYSRVVFSVINKAAGDTLSITWTYTLTVS